MERTDERATAGDVAWLERIVASGRTGVISHFPFSVARRILNSLRFPVEQQPRGVDRETLARAMYVATSSEANKEHKARFWEDDRARVTREHWMEEADRLLSILGGALVLEQQPRAWEWSTMGSDGKTMHYVLTRDRATAEAWMDEEEIPGTVTPLYAVQQPSNEEQQPIRCNCVQCSHHDAAISWLG